MTRSAIISGVVALILALFAASKALPMTSPRLPAPEELSGEWRLDWNGGNCALFLRAALLTVPRPAAETWSLEIGSECSDNAFLAQLGGWRPTSDGIELTDERGRTRQFLARTALETYESVAPQGNRVRMTRG